MVQNVTYRPTVYKTEMGGVQNSSTEIMTLADTIKYMFEVNDFLCVIKTWKNQQNDYI